MPERNALDQTDLDAQVARIAEGAAAIRYPLEPWQLAFTRAGLMMRIRELQAPWQLPDDPMNSDTFGWEPIGNLAGPVDFVAEPDQPRDIVDEIDALVDEQLAGYSQRSGYDHNVNQQRCPHCGDDWHGLAITERMQEMRWRGAFDEDYRYAEDESEVQCPGSEFIGPWATSQQLVRIRSGYDDPPRMRHIPDGPPRRWGEASRMNPYLDPEARPYSARLPEPGDRVGFEVGGHIEIVIVDELRGFADRIRESMDAMRESLARLGIAAGDQSLTVRRWLPGDPEPETPQQRALPRPSTTPPMWANDPTRTRRRRTR